MRKRISIITLALLLTFSNCLSLVLPFNNQASADPITPTMLAHYPLLEDVQDASGNGKHGTAVGNITYADGLTLPGGTDRNTNYVQLPTGLFDHQENTTISVWIKSNTGSGNYAALFYGTPAAENKLPTNYWLFNPSNPSGDFKSVFTDSNNVDQPWTTEIGVSGASTSQYQGQWVHYTTVITERSITGYINGVSIGTAAKEKTTASFGTDLQAYIGRSNYSGDATFAGSFQDLRIYGEALNNEDITAVYEQSFNEKQVQQGKLELSLGDISAVTESLELPSTNKYGALISWTSSDESAVSATGEVTLREMEQQVTLTATISLGGSQTTKEFVVTLLPKGATVEQIAVKEVSLNEAALRLSMGDSETLVATISPSNATNNRVVWTSSDSGVVVVNSTGKVTAVSSGTATITVQTEDGEFTATSAVTVKGKSLKDDLILHYDMKTTTEVDGQLVLKDVANKEVTFDGIFKNPNNGQFISNSEVGFISFNGGSSTSNSGYVEIPKGSNGLDLLQGLNEVTVSSIVNWTNDGTNRWIFGLGTVLTPETNKYFFVTPRHGSGSGSMIATGISKNGWPNEALVTGGANSNLIGGQWKHVTVSFSEASNRITLFVDGVKVASGNTKGLKLSDIINPDATFSGFIGKSIFSNDPYLQGSVADFQVYDRALTEQEMGELYQQEAAPHISKIRQLTVDDAANQLNIGHYLDEADQSADKITRNVNLPKSGKNGVNITWSSSNPTVISNSGTVQRPAVEAGNVQAELTATLTYQGVSRAAVFPVTILKQFDDQQKVDLDAEQLEIYNANNVKGNLRLVTAGEQGSTITWTSSRPAVVKGTAEAAGNAPQLGWVSRQATDIPVTLIATITNGTASKELTFNVTIKKAAAPVKPDAYFFAYFTGEYEGGEEISFATAKDPLFWKALNNGKSILQSNMGEKGLRDPFVIRSAEGDKFYMLATDLKMGESTNFDQAQMTGSHYMMVWESEDLVNWSEQRMIKVAPKTGGNTWAPEAIYDPVTGEYFVFWASSMKNTETYGDYNGRPEGQYNVMYYATTRDFYTFSEPKVMIDESLPTIDTTFIEHNNMLYRFTKSEVNTKVYVEKAPTFYYDKDGIAANGLQYNAVPGTRDNKLGLIGKSGNNEGQTIFKDIHEDKWYLFLDSWPYHVRYTTDLDSSTQYINNVLSSDQYALPPGPRHGTVIPISRAEYNALQEKYAWKGPAPSTDPVVHYSFDANTVNGTTLNDISGNGHHATLVGGATINEEDRIGKTGGALELNGSTGYVKLPDHLIQSLNLEKATFSTWVQMDKNQANQRIFDFASETGRQVNRNTMYLSTQGDTGSLEFAVVTPFTEKFSNDSTKLGSDYKYAVRNAGLLPTKTWQHVAITMDEFDAVLYVNGQEVKRSSTFNVEPRMLLETTMNYIGKSRNSSHNLFDGKLDDFRIYNRALSVEEIATLANEDVTPPVEQPSGAELILHYDMNDIDGATVVDQTGNFNGKWMNPSKAEWISTQDAGVLSFTGGTTNSYVELPQGVLDGLTDITVSSIVNWSGKNAAEWLYALGRPNSNTHYTYFTPRYNANGLARLGIATNAWNNESSTSTTGLKNNEWKVVTTVVSGTDGTLTLYIDGVAVASGSTNGMTLEQIKNISGSSGTIGKSFYPADPYFGGLIADFQIYDGAMTAADIASLKARADQKIASMKGMFVSAAKEKLTIHDLLASNTSKDEIISNVTLPTSGAYGTTISWTSDKGNIISTTGAVTRPANATGDQVVTLIAVFKDGTETARKTFTLMVKALPSDAASVDEAKAALVVHNISDVRGHLSLPKSGLYGTTITWASAQPNVVSVTGEVQRPAYGSGDVDVKLTATITLNSASATKEFMAKVKEMPAEENYAGYFFTYFTGEGSSTGEQVHFALSNGNDPLNWRELNNGKPVLTSTLGEKGVRDPFIIRSPEGDKFYMIATDLKINGNGNWGRAQTWGSRSIMVWESNDLVNWTDQRMVEVAPEEAGNTWAPEIMYDNTTGEYIVFWASRMFDDASHTGSAYQKMMYSKTRDFYTFTEPKVYLDYGFSIIDTTMIEHDGKVYRFTKDEQDNGASAPFGKMVFQEVGNSILDPAFKMINQGVGNMKWVEGPTIFKSNTDEKWYLFVDEFGGRGYIPFETTNLASGVWTLSSNYNLPASPRHGTVIPITQREYDVLSGKNVPVSGISLDKTTLSIVEGQSGQLTATVLPANATKKAVTWSSSNPAVATVSATGQVTAVAAGTAGITVTTVDGGFSSSATVTVTPLVEPTAPGEVTRPSVTAGNQKLTLKWSNPDDSDLVAIKITGLGNTEFKTVTLNHAASSYEVTGLANGTRYEFRITTVNAAGNESAGVVVSGTPQAPSSGDGSGGGNIPAPTAPQATGGSEPVVMDNGQIKIKPVASEKGASNVKLSADTVKRALDQTTGGKLQVRVEGDQSLNGLTIELAVDARLTSGSSTVDRIEINTGSAVVTVATELLGTGTSAGKTLGLSIKKLTANQLSASAQAQLNGEVVYDIELTIDGKKLTAFDGRDDLVIALPYTLKAAENPNNVIVYDVKDNGELRVVTNGKYNAVTGKVEFKPTYASKYAVAYVATSFKDVTQDWAKDAISGLGARGIVKGVGDGEFNPKGQVTRAEFITMLMNMLELSDESAMTSFSDVKQGEWYHGNIATAQKLGIVNGKPDGRFGVHENITREDMAVMAYKAIQMKQLALAGGEATAFKDEANIANYAKQAVEAIQGAGIINGVGNDQFAPKKNASRAEAAVMIYNVLGLM
ncbi:immunoglobulin-like domain-containing protein [Paenibacillus sp. 2KB_22]|uniref:immunoglobulin-like domain-containing protein n=1 Tax=Paenibacillus sp. 2KB_22 TaxID=3232978 RepID=UPI003F9D600A